MVVSSGVTVRVWAGSGGNVFVGANVGVTAGSGMEVSIGSGVKVSVLWTVGMGISMKVRVVSISGVTPLEQPEIIMMAVKMITCLSAILFSPIFLLSAIHSNPCFFRRNSKDRIEAFQDIVFTCGPAGYTYPHRHMPLPLCSARPARALLLHSSNHTTCKILAPE